jgi:cobyrinic acid a,c-diamide synthase
MSKAIIIAGTHSGVGKTTITVGLTAALRRLDVVVQPFKVGPDYIDPTYHRAAAGRPCRNLDTWMMPPERVRALFAAATRDVDLAVIEGVMGLFDGAGYDDETGSTAQIAKLIGSPVILVIDAAKLARSAGALALGYQRFDGDVPLAGFIVNRVGSERHGQGVATAIEKSTGLRVLGWLPRHAPLQIAERHLGLVPAVEPENASEFSAAAEEMVRTHIDLPLLQEIAAMCQNRERAASDTGPAILDSRPAPVIAVARDEAFHFIYEENLELLRKAGAEIAFFSPIADSSLPPDTAGIILSGGFPEMNAAALAANQDMLQAVRQAHQQGLPFYAECGGLMYLTEALVNQRGRCHEMVGVLPGRSVMGRRLTLGYRRARAAASSWLFDAGEEVRGHEFHYSEWEDRPANLPPAYLLQSADGTAPAWPEGARLGNLWASYVHLHFWGKPELAARFVQVCRPHHASREKVGAP